MNIPPPAITNRKRFIAVLSLLLVGGFLLTSLVGYRVAHESLSHQIRENALPLTSDNIYSEIQQDLLRPIFISSLMAQDTFLRDWVLDGEQDSEAVIRYLTEIQDRYNTVTSFFVSKHSRNYYHPSGVIKQVSESDPRDSWFYRTINLPPGKSYEINIDTDTADPDKTNIFVNYRVYDYQGKAIGVGGVGLAAQSVSQIIATYQQRYGRRVFFVDRNGQTMLQGKDAEPALPLRQQPGLQQLATKILTSPGGSYTYESNGRQVYLNSRMIPEFNWYLLVEQIGDPSETRLLNTLLVNLVVSLLITAVVIVLAYLTLGRYQRKLEMMATYDKLTGAVNREVFETLLRKSLHDATRTGEAFSVIMLDLDHFKQINDTHGHLVGDKVLVRTADLIQQRIRESDTLCRWGGEEFLLALPHCEHAEAIKLAEELRQALAQTQHFPDAPDIDLSASFGVVGFSGRESATSLIARADRSMYTAKKNGRNQVASGESQINPHPGMKHDVSALGF